VAGCQPRKHRRAIAPAPFIPPPSLEGRRGFLSLTPSGRLRHAPCPADAAPTVIATFGGLERKATLLRLWPRGWATEDPRVDARRADTERLGDIRAPDALRFHLAHFGHVN
jgi:hypothetical protein